MPERRFPPPWSVEELDALLCQIESRIKKTQHLGLESFCTQTNRALGVSGGWGKAPDLPLLWAGDYSESV
jgi:hypothetical protein